MKVERGIWRLRFKDGDPDRPALGRFCTVWIELPNGYRSDRRDVWESDLLDLASLLLEVNPCGDFRRRIEAGE